MNKHSSQKLPSLRKDRSIKKEGLWARFFAFLNQDIEEISPSDKKIAHAVEPSGVDIESQLNLQADYSLVDINKLQYMTFRRQVLDWRDTFHANMITTVTRLFDEFIQQTTSDLDNTHLFRKVLARPSSEVLQNNFTLLVRHPLITALRKEEMNFTACSRQWGLPKRVELRFDIRILNAECAGLNGLSFKPSNKELIVSRVQELLLGSGGVAENFCEQGHQFLRNVLDIKETL